MSLGESSVSLGQSSVSLVHRFSSLSERTLGILSVLVFFLFWESYARFFQIEDVIASPIIVTDRLISILVEGEWIVHVVASGQRVVVAFLITMVISIVLGVLLATNGFLEGVLLDYIVIGLSIPGLFVVVFSAMWFGISFVTPIVAIVILTFTYTTLIVYEGVKDIDADLIYMSQAFGVSRRRMYTDLMVRDVVPEIFAGARYTFVASWRISVLAEYIAASSGIGFVIEGEMAAFDLAGVLAWVAIFASIVLFFEYGLLRWLHGILFDWTDTGGFLGWAAE